MPDNYKTFDQLVLDAMCCTGKFVNDNCESRLVMIWSKRKAWLLMCRRMQHVFHHMGAIKKAFPS